MGATVPQQCAAGRCLTFRADVEEGLSIIEADGKPEQDLLATTRTFNGISDNSHGRSQSRALQLRCRMAPSLCLTLIHQNSDTGFPDRGSRISVPAPFISESRDLAI